MRSMVILCSAIGKKKKTCHMSSRAPEAAAGTRTTPECARIQLESTDLGVKSEENEPISMPR